MKSITQEKFEPTEEEIVIAELVLLNKANVETIEPIVKKYQTDILKKHKFRCKRKIDREYIFNKYGTEYIINPDHTYLLNNSDFTIYLKEVAIQHKKHGFKVKKDYCPLLIAKSNLTDSENLLINIVGKRFNIKASQLYKIELREKFIDCSLNLIGPFLSDHETILKKYGA